LAIGCGAVGDASGTEGDKADDPFAVRYIQNAEEIDALVTQVVNDSFPELPLDRISIKGARKDPFVFFWAQPEFGSVLNPFAETTYRVFYNTRLFDTNSQIAPLPYEAVRSILAHELGHVSDYETTTFGLLRTGWTQVVHGKSESRNERRTDLGAIARGYADGLKTYRRWIYGTLSGDDLARKREIYFTPEEISLVEWAIGEYPELIQYWRRTPPLSLQQIEADIASLDAGAALPESIGCDEDQFDCNDGSCINSWQLCDGTSHCPGGEDEGDGCNQECPDSMFVCGSGECIPASAACDLFLDCFDYSDEAECS